ncbi:MAG TPA: hypothetical protein VGZ22_17685 [Isosphaeraceae bacterium]|jgi:hypothetical protein|nr:hypothetical protein [Isosphaeraceae bacterium]
MLRPRIQSGLAHVGQALREPEEFALRWHSGDVDYPLWVWGALLLTAMLGTSTYGMTMGLLGGPHQVVLGAFKCTTAAGLAWGIALPALYILNSLGGSRLRMSTTVLAALVTTSWGGLAMIASIPINWFFTVSLPGIVSTAWVPAAVRLVNLVVFTGVGVSMSDVFGRVMARLEPDRGRLPLWWLLVVGAIGTELFYAFGLFQFVMKP